MKMSEHRQEFFLNLLAGVIIIHYAGIWASIILRTGTGPYDILFNLIFIMIFAVVAIKISNH